MLTESFHIRPWQENDLPLLAGLEARSQPFPWSLKHFSASFSGGHAGLILIHHETDGREQPVAFAVIGSVLDESSLLNICVDGVFQGQGLGRRLLSHIVDEQRKHGQKVLLLEVRCGNQRAISLYESMGFRQDGVRRGYYPARKGREDALLYSMVL